MMKKHTTGLSSHHAEITFLEAAHELAEIATESDRAIELIRFMLKEYNDLDTRCWDAEENASELQKFKESHESTIATIYATYDMTTTGFRDNSDLAAVILQAIA
jgi:hypothetical protein